MRGVVQLVATALLLGGCVAPILTVVDLRKAEAEIQAAKNADAPQWAAYEYTSAMAYLHRARELFGSSGPHYQDAYEYAEKSFRLAKLALEKAADHPKE